MGRKSFDAYIEKRLDKKEIAVITQQAKREKKVFKAWQQEIKRVVNEYMKKHNIGFNDLVKILDISPTQMSKIQKGEANLTLASMASIFASLNQEPQLIFKKK